MTHHNECVEKMIVLFYNNLCTTCVHSTSTSWAVEVKDNDSNHFPIKLTFAKSIGWIAILAIVAAVPPQTKGSAIFAALFSGMFKFCFYRYRKEGIMARHLSRCDGWLQFIKCCMQILCVGHNGQDRDSLDGVERFCLVGSLLRAWLGLNEVCDVHR